MDESTGEPPDPWALRASDADRDAYLELLREAFAEGRLDPMEHEERVEAALSAKTYRDLYQVLAELPVEPRRIPGPPAPVVGTSAPPAVGRLVPVPVAGAVPPAVPDPKPDTSLTAILGSAQRNGRWLVPAVQQVTSVLGEVELDLTSAVLSDISTEIRCLAILGDITITVPESLRVELAGNPVMGEFSRKDKRKRADRRRVPAPDAPVVRVTGLAMLAEVKVRTVRPVSGSEQVSLLSGEPAPSPETPARAREAIEDPGAIAGEAEPGSGPGAGD